MKILYFKAANNNIFTIQFKSLEMTFIQQGIFKHTLLQVQ